MKNLNYDLFADPQKVYKELSNIDSSVTEMYLKNLKSRYTVNEIILMKQTLEMDMQGNNSRYVMFISTISIFTALLAILTNSGAPWNSKFFVFLLILFIILIGGYFIWNLLKIEKKARLIILLNLFLELEKRNNKKTVVITHQGKIKRVKSDEGEDFCEMEMNRERFEQIKRNNKNALGYMKKVEKTFLHGKTLKDKMDFINEFNEYHTDDDINYLYYEMTALKDDNSFFTNGFFTISIPMYTILFSIITFFANFVLTINNSATVLLLQKEMEKTNPNFERIFNGSFETFSIVTKPLSIAIMLVLVSVLLSFFIRDMKNSKRLKYISWLESIKEKRRNESNKKDQND